jgi:septal ring factor EnvC (AmiA/AmiB activator)
MKNILILKLSLFIVPLCSFSQTNQEKTSKYLVSILRDSLNLSENQVQDIYKINLTLEEQKKNVRSMEDLIDNKRKKVQKIENSRDSLYASVLNLKQFEAYKNRKSSLLNVVMPAN